MWNVSLELTLGGCVIYICCVGFVSLDLDASVYKSRGENVGHMWVLLKR